MVLKKFARSAARPARVGSLALLIGAQFSVVAPALAQTAADINEAARQADILQRQQQQRIERDRELAVPTDRAPSGLDTRALEPKVDASSVGKKCHEISTIRITGSPNLTPDVQRQIVQDFSGRCLGVTEIEQILAEITRDYIARGYVTTRAYLPQQDLSKGTLEITVLEGVVEKIMLEDGEKGSIRLGTVFPETGELLNLRDLEQGIEQVSKLSSNNATMDIQPGAKPGESTVVIRNQPKTPFHASFSGDNQGSESTGRQQYGLTLMSDRLLNMNELLLYTHRRSHPHDEDRQFSESDSFSAIVPFGYSTLTLSMSRSRYTLTAHMNSGLDVSVRGKSANDSLKFDHVVLRNASTRLSFSSTLTLKDTKTWIADIYHDSSSHKLTVLDLDASLTTGLGGGLFGIDVGLAQGLKVFGADRDADDLLNDSIHAQFQKLKFGLSYTIPFRMAEKDFSFSTQLTGQVAQDTLYGSEKMLIGGIYTVRGFVNNTLAGDRGYYVRNELSMRDNLVLGDEAVAMRYFVGFDFGQVRNNVVDAPSGHLSGFAFGFSTSWRGATLEIFNTRPLDFPNTFTREAPQTWVRFNYAI